MALIMVLAGTLPASAQIYSWRDANGNLVLSNTQRPPNGTASRTYSVTRAEGVRSTTDVPSGRTNAYDDLIVEHAQLNGVRPDLVRAVIQVESAYNARASSPKGAMGLMQLMPATARQFGVINAYNPAENVRAGVTYLRQLLDRYGNNEELALAAYNAGPGAVAKYGETIPPYRETRDYVTKVNKIAGVKQVPGAKIYQVTRIIDGRQVVVFTDKKPE
jgi:soluble lytic murein transglycosylase-like protein